MNQQSKPPWTMPEWMREIYKDILYPEDDLSDWDDAFFDIERARNLEYIDPTVSKDIVSFIQANTLEKLHDAGLLRESNEKVVFKYTFPEKVNHFQLNDLRIETISPDKGDKLVLLLISK